MKVWTWLLAISLLISAVAAAQNSATLSAGSNSQGSGYQADSGDRMFFPHDMFWGWAQLDLAPPHNEIDPNLCAGNVAQFGGINDAVRDSGSPSLWPGPATPIHGVRCAHVSIRQKPAQDALHLVTRCNRDRTFLGRRSVYRQRIRIPRHSTLLVRPARRA
jgi:hypothetical protein